MNRLSSSESVRFRMIPTVQMISPVRLNGPRPPRASIGLDHSMNWKPNAVVSPLKSLQPPSNRMLTAPPIRAAITASPSAQTGRKNSDADRMSRGSPSTSNKTPTRPIIATAYPASPIVNVTLTPMKSTKNEEASNTKEQEKEKDYKQRPRRSQRSSLNPRPVYH